MVLSILALWQRRWWQQLRQSALVVAAPSCSECSGNAAAVSASGRLTLAAARARSGYAIVLSSLRQQWRFDAVGLHGHCAQSDSMLWCVIWMQWMHHDAQHARAVAAALVAAAEALYTRGGSTLVQRMQ